MIDTEYISRPPMSEQVNKITLSRAIALELGVLDQPAVTTYQLGLIVFRLYLDKQVQGHPLRITKPVPGSSEFSAALSSVLESGVLQPLRTTPKIAAFEILGRRNAPAREIACTVDPFCYLSHLSAMAFHGITDRISRTLYLTTPPSTDWRRYALDRMHSDLGGDYDQYLSSGFPELSRPRLQKIDSTPIYVYSSLHLGAFRSIRGKSLRVATIGRTFLDMLREPRLCGGIAHVVSVFEKHANAYVRLIADELEAHGKPIDKVRAGYILTERCQVKDSTIESWARFAKRGGSQKLDASGEYSPTFSERWCLSINVPLESLDSIS